MNHELRIKGKTFFALILFVFALIFPLSRASAQNITPDSSTPTTGALSTTPPASTGVPTGSTKAYGITFPIAELGNCANLTACKNYCDDDSHKAACIAYAKQKGFYKDTLNENKEKILQAAQTVLGCNSVDSCKALCSLAENYDKCSAFAKENNLAGGIKKDINSNETLTKAKEVLGCASVEDCRNFCSNPANKNKCTTFAKEEGLNGGERVSGPGGCISQATCQVFCQNPANTTICKDFIESHGGEPGSAASTTPMFTPTEDFCKLHPDQCQPPAGSTITVTPFSSTPPEDLTSKINECQQHIGCTWNPTLLICKCVTPTPLSTNITKAPTPTSSQSSNTSSALTPTVSPTPAVMGAATMAPLTVWQQIWKFLLSK